MERENGITVKRLLEAPIMRQVSLVAGKKGVNKIISRANTFADDDILDWVSPHEILLMTSPNFRDWSVSEFVHFVTRAAELHLSALAIKFAVTGERLPPEVLAEADRRELPIIVIDPVTSVADVGSEVFSQIFSLQASLLRKHEELYEELLLTLAEGGSIRDVLAIVQRMTENPVAFGHGDRSDVVVVGAQNEEERELLKDDVRRAMARVPPRTAVAEVVTELSPQQKVARVSVPVTSKHYVHGTLFIWGLTHELTRFDLTALESVSTSLALLIMQEKSLREVEIKHSSEFIDDLLTEATRTDALDRARIYNLDIEERYVMCLIRLLDCNSNDNIEYCTKDVYDFIYNHLRWISATLKNHEIKGLVTTRRADIQVLAVVDGRADYEARLDAFSEEVVQQLGIKASASDPIEVRLGIGKPYLHLKNVWRSYADADKTLVVGSRLFDRPVLKFSDLGIFRILVQGELNDELERYFQETLKALLEYDRKKSTELVRTLEVYFRNNGNINRTSEELFTHYNTVLYRLERIQEITGLDLGNANDRLNLELAMKLRSLYPQQP